MRVTPWMTERRKGEQPEEPPKPCADRPCPPHSSPLLARNPFLGMPQLGAPEVVPPAEEGRGEASAVAWGVPVENPPPLAKTYSLEHQQWNRHSSSELNSKQAQKLETIFRKKHFPPTEERRQLAASLGLTERQVKTWFRNRRAKWREQNQDQPRSKQYQDQSQSFLPSAPFSWYNPWVLTSFPQDFSIYQQQNVPPFMPDFGLPSCSHCPLYQPSQSSDSLLYQSPLNPPYPLLAPSLPVPPEILIYPAVLYGLDCMPSPHSAE